MCQAPRWALGIRGKRQDGFLSLLLWWWKRHTNRYLFKMYCAISKRLTTRAVGPQKGLRLRLEESRKASRSKEHLNSGTRMEGLLGRKIKCKENEA